MTAFPFVKMHGAANDFVVIDHRRPFLPDEPSALAAVVQRLCDRRRGVGADGVLLVGAHPTLDFTMHYLNRDGGPAEFCGNGARCVAQFALDRGLGRDGVVRFDSDVGPQEARRVDGGIELLFGGGRRIDAPVPQTVALNDRRFEGVTVDTGVPHYVVQVEKVEWVPVAEWGAALRHHARFEPAGTNVDFVARLDPDRVALRTYERGVEAETLACGSGAMAAALATLTAGTGEARVAVLTAGGDELVVRARAVDGGFDRVRLTGPAEVAFTGEWSDGGEARRAPQAAVAGAPERPR